MLPSDRQSYKVKHEVLFLLPARFLYAGRGQSDHALMNCNDYR